MTTEKITATSAQAIDGALNYEGRPVNGFPGQGTVLDGWTEVWMDGKFVRFERELVNNCQLYVTNHVGGSRWEWTVWWNNGSYNERVAYDQFPCRSALEAVRRGEEAARVKRLLG